MSITDVVGRQYRRLVDSAADHVGAAVPNEGWLRTVRKALGMSGADLARRSGVTRARVAQAEQSELEGAITLKSMQAFAEAMGCRFVYSIVPPQHVENLLLEQARKKARALVTKASKHLALEDQALSEREIEAEVDTVARELIRSMPADFWRD